MSFSDSVARLVTNSRDPLLAAAPWWVRVPLGNVCGVINGYPLVSQYFNDSSGVPVIRIRDVTSGQSSTYYSGPSVDGYWVNDGDLVVGMDGDFNSRIWYGNKALLNQRVCKIVPDERFLNRYFLAYGLPGYLNLINQATHSITVKHLSSKTVSEIPFPLPPIGEQHRIVAKLESLFAHTRCAREELARIPTLIKHYKEAILAAAFRGELTADWRAENLQAPALPNLPADVNRRYSRRVSSPDEAAEFLPPFDLPDTWQWIPLPRLGILDRGRSRHRPRNDPRLFGGPYPFIQTGEIKAANGVLTSYEQTYSDFGLSQSRLWPRDTVCITIAANIAETAILGIEACFPDSVVGFIAEPRLCIPSFVEFFIRTVRDDLARFAPATAQKNINLNTLSKVHVPVPPLEEQQAIVSRVESAYSHIDQITSDIERAVTLLDHLDQSTLSKAFRGELVPQDPNDEPASVLFDRIRAARSPMTNVPRVRRRA